MKFFTENPYLKKQNKLFLKVTLNVTVVAVVVFETGFHCVALAVLELTL